MECSSASPRVVMDGVLSPQECQELMYIARCLAVVGYRAAVASATCFEVAAAEPALLLPLMAAREKVRAAVEGAMGLDLGLLVEFTGLISWRPGAGIDFHHDANRPYLQQREYSAVTYLDASGPDFGGGAFQFQRGAPAQVLPAPGKVVAYHANDVHGVQPVTGFGERFTLTLWFTTDPEHDEDRKLLSRLAERYQPPLGLPASMYQLPYGFDLRLCRLAMMGFGLASGGRPLTTLAATTSSSGGGGSGGGDAALDGRTGGGSAREGFCGEGSTSVGPIQLVVHAARLAAWQSRSGGSSSTVGQHGLGQRQQEPGSGEPEAAAAAAVLLGVEFPGVEQAVLALQYWAWQRQPERWAQEEVCCRHLCEPGPGQGGLSDCGWVAALGGQQLAAAQLLPGQGWLAEVCREVREAADAAEAYLGGLRRQYNAVVPAWRQAGGVF